MINDIEEIIELIAEYEYRHPLVKECGSDYIYQNDKAQIDAIQLVADIFDNKLMREQG